ncbi:MAG TPA: FG-GAP-like repeat-containing protein [Caulobacteraceae bacterium]|nr:FG-GAP-like repeat-containing protein [Caulobacteraceae bacterium]
MSNVIVTVLTPISSTIDVGGTDQVDVLSGGTISTGSSNAIIWNTNATSAGVEIDNSGSISSQAKAITLANGPTGSISINNYGSITGGLAIGLGVGSGPTETITNYAGTIGTSGAITGSVIGLAIFMGNGADTLNVYTGSTILGRVIVGSHTGTLNLDGAGAGTFYGESNGTNGSEGFSETGAFAFAGWDGFSTVNVNGGTWTLDGGGYYNQVSIAPGATLVVNEASAGQSNAEGTPNDSGIGPIGSTWSLVNNGAFEIITGSDSALYYTASAPSSLAYSGAGSFEVAGGGLLYINPALNLTIAGGVTVASGSVIILGAVTAPVTIASGATLQIGAGGTVTSQDGSYTDTGMTGSVTGAIVDNGTLTFDRLDAYALTGALTGNGVLDVIGTGALTLGSATNFNGTVYLLAGSLINAGTIYGDVHLGNGAITLTSTGTMANYAIYLGSGADTVNLNSTDNMTVEMGSGADTVNGGGGLSAVSYYNAAGGVTVSLALQGVAQVTGGAGTDTISNIHALYGSQYDDTLIAGSGDDTFHSNGGSDTFVFTPGVGNDVIFQWQSGDRIYLEGFSGLHSFADIQALISQPSGSYSTITLPGGGSVSLWGVDGTTLTAANFELSPTASSFTGDASSNIVWQNTSGQIAVWTVSGTALSGSILPIATPGWTLQDTGDFNGDGKSGDLLFRDGAGDVAIWTMNGLNQVAPAVVATVPLSWKIEGTGDFNGDGKSDILWDNTVTGQLAIWEMNGTAIQSAQVIATLPAEWKIAGTADFNGDGKSDILWRDANTGQVAIWEMNGVTPALQAVVASAIPLDWHIVGTGDFNGDGKADILWQNSDTGQVAIWEMNGAAIQTPQVIATLPTDWHVVGTGDFNGDGKADIVWQNSDTGQTAVWEMNGFTPTNLFYLSTVDHSWKVLDHHFDWV